MERGIEVGIAADAAVLMAGGNEERLWFILIISRLWMRFSAKEREDKLD